MLSSAGITPATIGSSTPRPVNSYTGVPSAVGGRGIAAELVRVALAWAESQGYTVEPSCSYVEVYMRRHPETQKLLAR